MWQYYLTRSSGNDRISPQAPRPTRQPLSTHQGWPLVGHGSRGHQSRAGVLWLDGICGSSGNVLGVGGRAHVEQQSVAPNQLTSQDLFRTCWCEWFSSHRYWSDFFPACCFCTPHNILNACVVLRKLRVGNFLRQNCDQPTVNVNDFSSQSQMLVGFFPNLLFLVRYAKSYIFV